MIDLPQQRRDRTVTIVILDDGETWSRLDGVTIATIKQSELDEHNHEVGPRFDCDRWWGLDWVDLDKRTIRLTPAEEWMDRHEKRVKLRANLEDLAKGLGGGWTLSVIDDCLEILDNF